MSQKNNDLLFLASKYLNNEVASEEEALQGARTSWQNGSMKTCMSVKTSVGYFSVRL
jgi:hypothetical protein